MHRFLFGPVNSRRLGRSLGVDLLPFKTCSLDCIYCECGWTTDKTVGRGELDGYTLTSQSSKVKRLLDRRH